MNCKCFVFVCLLVTLVVKNLSAQTTDSLQQNIVPVDTSIGQSMIVEEVPAPPLLPASITKPAAYFNLLSHTVVDAVKKPFSMRSREWGQVGVFSAALGATLLLDRPINESVQKLRSQSGLIRHSSPVITQLGGFTGLAVIGGFGVYGCIAKDQKMKTTVLLASQSFLITGVATAGIKMITGRTRPDFYNHWKGPDYYFKTNAAINGYCPEYNSFPSGHTSTAFSIATVFARQYSNKKWVPVLSYGLASMVGMTRIVENRHWASDVLAGAALGYLCGNLVMANYKRMNKKKTAKNLL